MVHPNVSITGGGKLPAVKLASSPGSLGTQKKKQQQQKDSHHKKRAVDRDSECKDEEQKKEEVVTGCVGSNKMEPKSGTANEGDRKDCRLAIGEEDPDSADELAQFCQIAAVQGERKQGRGRSSSSSQHAKNASSHGNKKPRAGLKDGAGANDEHKAAGAGTSMATSSAMPGLRQVGKRGRLERITGGSHDRASNNSKQQEEDEEPPTKVAAALPPSSRMSPSVQKDPQVTDIRSACLLEPSRVTGDTSGSGVVLTVVGVYYCCWLMAADIG